jgi:hypothetical protein
MSTHVRAKGRRVRSRSLFALAWQLLLMVAVSMSCGGRAHCSPWTEGEKTLLYLRVDFSDLPGEPVSEAAMLKVFADINTFWDANSQGKISLKSTVTPVLRKTLPPMATRAASAARRAGRRPPRLSFQSEEGLEVGSKHEDSPRQHFQARP